jgi:signal transduction histidine kinase
VDAAAVELCLTNYVSNAIKYADPARPDRRVEVSGRSTAREASGGRRAHRGRARQRRRRAGPRSASACSSSSTAPRAAPRDRRRGDGLGLSLVRETVESLGGRAWADFPGAGRAVFAFSLPSRRAADAAAAGITRAG